VDWSSHEIWGVFRALCKGLDNDRIANVVGFDQAFQNEGILFDERFGFATAKDRKISAGSRSGFFCFYSVQISWYLLIL